MRNKSYYDKKRRTADRRYQQTKMNQRYRRPRRSCFSPFWIIFVVGIILLAIVIAGIFLKSHNNQRTEEVIEDVNSDTLTSANAEENLQNENVISEGDSVLEEDIYYYRATLSAEDRMMYDIILKGIRNCDTSILVNTTDTDLIFHIINMVMADHPELFWIDGSCQTVTSSDHMEIKFPYLYTRSEIEHRQTEIDHCVEEVLSRVSENESDYDKIKLIYEYIIDTVDYVYGCEDDQNLYSALVNRKSVCAGYSRAMQYLLQKMGIQALYVAGIANGTGGWDNHAWNIVRCNGAYYHVDCTFGDDYPGAGYSFGELGIYNYAYLCIDDGMISTNHKRTDTNISVPVCDQDDLNYFKLNGMYSEVYDDDVDHNLKSSIEKGNRIWMWQFSNYAAYQDFLNNCRYAEYVSEYLNASSQIRYIYNDDMHYVFYWY